LAVDVLFTPKQFWLETSEIWEFLQEKREHLLHSGMGAFVGFSQKQAYKYSIKGDRLKTANTVFEILCNFSDEDRGEKLSNFKDGIIADTIGLEHIAFIISQPDKNGKTEEFLEVCGKKISMHLPVFRAKEIVQGIINQYGDRAKAAETNNGVDFKALYHAIRVLNEAKELLTDHFITFPRPEAKYLLQIRKGEIPYKQIADELDQGIIEIGEIREKSTLPKKIDMDKWNKIIMSIYADTINDYRMEKLLEEYAENPFLARKII
jgi:hypothetical protein